MCDRHRPVILHLYPKYMSKIRINEKCEDYNSSYWLIREFLTFDLNPLLHNVTRESHRLNW